MQHLDKQTIGQILGGEVANLITLADRPDDVCEVLSSLINSFESIKERSLQMKAQLLAQMAPDVCPICKGTGRVGPRQMLACADCNGTGRVS